MMSSVRLVAILAADVEGYSRHMEQDELNTLSTLFAYRRTIEDLLLRHRGRLVSTAGDSFLAEFASVGDAADCAIGIQESLGAANSEKCAGRRLRFRIGIHMGDVMVQDGDIFGDSVNLAARLQAHAPKNGVLISDAVHAQIRGKIDAAFIEVGALELKNIALPVRAWRWGGGIEFLSPAGGFGRFAAGIIQMHQPLEGLVHAGPALRRNRGFALFQAIVPSPQERLGGAPVLRGPQPHAGERPPPGLDLGQLRLGAPVEPVRRPADERGDRRPATILTHGAG